MLLRFGRYARSRGLPRLYLREVPMYLTLEY